MTPQDPVPHVAEAQIDAGPFPDAGSDPQLAADLPETSPNEAAVITPEDAAPMIDIHPPHHGSITRRDFFVHLFTVVLGILIAIGLEQSVEYIHHRQLATEAAGALLKERSFDETANDFNIFAIGRHEHDLQHDLAVLDALRAHRTVPPGPFIVQRKTSIYAKEQWQRIHQSGTINYMTGNLGASGFRYGVQDYFSDLLGRSNEDLARAASVLRSSSDPPNRSFEQNMAFADFFRRLEDAHESLPQQQIDAAWATEAEHGNVAALSPAQIDSLERAIQIALADDDAMLTDCFTIKRNLIRNPVH
ncbi:MAG TPA: hypothetical protein VII58_08205 [Acidobacteriaceae bacterium]